MALATRCPNCHALFRVAADQLKLRGGLVRCGACERVFDATGTLSYIDDAALAHPSQATTPAVGAVIAAIRKAESSASEALSGHGAATLPSAPPADDAPRPEELPCAWPPEQDEGTAAIVASRPEARPEADAPEPAEQVTVDGAAEAPPPADAEPADTVQDPNRGRAVAEPTVPAFLREADARGRRRRTALFSSGALLLAIVLLAQLAVAFRADLLAKFPSARPALEGLCRVFRCTVDWPARVDLLAVVGSELQALPGTDAFELATVVRNRGNMTLALPAIELTLSDTLNRTVARRVFSPEEYLAGEADPRGRLRAGLEPGADLAIRIAFEARGVNAAGFVVYPFYL
jgi:predicted Zn finger-like uncharacterized protein